MKQQNNQIEWKEVKLREIALVDSGQGAPQGENYFNGEDIFIRAGDLNNLTNNLYVGDYCEKITEEAIGKRVFKGILIRSTSWWIDDKFLIPKTAPINIIGERVTE